MSSHEFTAQTWREMDFHRPIEIEAIHDVLAHLAATHPRSSAIVLEARGEGGRVRYLIGAEESQIHKFERIFRSHVDVRFTHIYRKPRRAAVGAARITTSKKLLSLNTDTAEAVLRGALAALANAPHGEENIVQIVLGGSYGPVPMSYGLQDPNASFLDIVSGRVKKATSDTVKSIKEKADQSGFEAVIRIGSTSRTNFIGRLHELTSAFRILESAGVKIYAGSEPPAHLSSAKVPWRFPLRLSVKEIACFTLYPTGEDELPGASPLHPKSMLPPSWYQEPRYKSEERTFALALNGQKLSIPPDSALTHTIVTGATGAGKSTVLLSMILADINAGRGVLVIDPKQSLVDEVLERIPQHRRDDVVVLDPVSPCPVGFNPLNCTNGQDKELVADAVLSALKAIWADNWGLRISDQLTAALLTLMNVDGATLMWLPEMFSNATFRESITKSVGNDVALSNFWKNFEALSEHEKKQHVEVVLNKLRAFYMRPRLRHCLGQSHPKFNLNDLFTKQKIVLVPLNKGILGDESARLLGSLVVSLTWTIAQGRAALPPEERKMVSMYIDELQDYLNLPTDLSSSLAMARSLGLAIHLSHQYRDQIPLLLRSGIDANALSKIVFNVGGKDARDMATLGDGLEPLDFASLPRYHIYAKLQNYGRDTGWIEGVTIPKLEPLQSAAELRAVSMRRYGIPAEQVEADLVKTFKTDTPPPEEESKSFKKSSINRRKPKEKPNE